MKVAVAYEGWKKADKRRYDLVNKVACAGFEDYKGKTVGIKRDSMPMVNCQLLLDSNLN